MKIAAAYIRVSTDDQAEYSPDAQLRLIRAWADNNGYYVDPTHIYADEGISGRRAEKRPAFMRMIGEAKRKPSPFEAILVHKFDRFARSREDSVVYKSMLRRDCGVQVISITESIDDDKFSVILEAMLEAMAEYYSINLADEVRKGMTEKARRGERQTGAPFGYRSKDGSLVPEPGEAALVVEVFERFAAGDAYFSIARWLNELGMRTRHGNSFQNRTIRYILTNQTYIGKNLWTPKRRSNTSGYQISEETIISDSSHAAIVPMELWCAAQRRIDELRVRFPHSSQPAKHADWPSGLLRCPHCGSVMVRNLQGAYADGRPKVYWLCNGYAHGKCLHSNSSTDAIIKGVVIEALRSLASRTGDLLSAIQAKRRSAGNPYPAMLARVSQQLKRAAEAYRNGIDSLEEYAAAKKMLLEERRRIEEAERSDLGMSDAEAQRAAERLANTIQGVASLLESDSPMEAKHDAVHEIIDHVIFDRDSHAAFAILNHRAI